MIMKHILIIFFISIIYAQDPSVSNLPANYKIGNDEITMPINLWGHVRNPGSYSIPIEFGLLELLSNAGGPTGNANLNDVKIVRKNNEIVRVNIKKYLDTGDYTIIKDLQPGDMVIVGGSLNNAFKDIIGYLRDLGIVLNTIYITSRLQNIK
jgi:polysaccharide export outer membrane protein